MSENLENQSSPKTLETSLESPVVYSDQELANYALELQATIDEYNLSGKDKDKDYYQTIQRLEMSSRGWMFVGVDSPKAQEQLHVLFTEFGGGFSGVNRERDFDATQESIEESSELLGKLPFVKEEAITKPVAPDRFEIDGKIEVPLEVVIGGTSLESWAGRRAGHLKNGRSSLEVIREYASKGKYDGSSGLLDAIVVRGSDGKAYLYLESSHRVAAAKLRGDKSIIVDSITLSSKPWTFELL